MQEFKEKKKELKKIKIKHKKLENNGPYSPALPNPKGCNSAGRDGSGMDEALRERLG